MNHLKEDKWLGTFLGKNAYALDLSNNISSLQEEIKGLPGKVFIYAKINSTDLKKSFMLESLGFHLIDTNVSFEKNISAADRKPESISVRKAEPKDKESVMRLAKDNFIYSRFHLDPDVPKETADLIKAEWVGNYFKGNRGDEMLIAEVAEKTAGFAQLLYREKMAVIDLIASDSAFRRRGVSTAIINAISEFKKDAEKIIVGTQVANIPSMRLYEKNGFRISDSKYIFHYHGKEQ